MNELTQIPYGDPQRIGLSLPEGLEIDQWKQIGHKLFQCRESLMFWIGDWINYGEATYGNKYEEAKKVFGAESELYGGYDEITLRRAASVCAKVPVVLRRTSLTFGHHSVVATLPQSDQKKWLKQAEDEKLSVRALTELIRGKLKEKAATQVNATHDVFIFERWINEAVRGLQAFPVKKWEDDQLAKRISTLQSIQQPLIDEAKSRPTMIDFVNRVKAVEVGV